ncbi:hypothetical protein Tco_0116270 [Tanacetum coccineum]
MNPSCLSNVPTESYEGAWQEMRQHKFFDNVTTDHLEDIMASPPPQEKSSRQGSIGHISFEMHVSWYKFAMRVNERETSHQETKHLKNTSKSAKNSMFRGLTLWDLSPYQTETNMSFLGKALRGQASGGRVHFPKDFADEEPSEDDPSKEERVTTSPSPLPSSPPFRLSRKRCRSPTPSPTDIPQPPSRMVPPCKRVRDAPAVSSQQDTPAEATCEDIPSTFETGESLAAIVAQVLLVTCETGEQTIPLADDEAFSGAKATKTCEKIDDDIKTLQASLESVEQELVTLRAIVRTLKQHDEVTRESLRIARDRITLLQIEAVVTKQLASDLQDAQVTYRLEITELRRRVEDRRYSF